MPNLPIKSAHQPDKLMVSEGVCTVRTQMRMRAAASSIGTRKRSMD